MPTVVVFFVSNYLRSSHLQVLLFSATDTYAHTHTGNSPASQTGNGEDDVYETKCQWDGCNIDFDTQSQLVDVSYKITLFAMCIP